MTATFGYTAAYYDMLTAEALGLMLRRALPGRSTTAVMRDGALIILPPRSTTADRVGYARWIRESGLNTTLPIGADRSWKRGVWA